MASGRESIGIITVISIQQQKLELIINSLLTC